MIHEYLPMDENPNISDIPGVRFRPSDEELITYYLQRKVKCLPLPANVINDIELYSYNPWDLPRRALFGEDEWYFFTPRDRKYPNGRRPNRTTASGYWKATGTDKPIFGSFGSKKIGVKKALVFYQGKPPSGVKKDWIMTEYRLPDASRPSRSKGSMRLDEWVICRIRQKGNMSKNVEEKHQNSSKLLQYLPKMEDLHPLSTEEGTKDILSEHLLSSEYRLIASLLIGEGRFNNTPTFSLFENTSNALQGQTNMIVNEQRDMACQSGNNIRASFGTNYLYWQNVSEGNVFNPSYSTNGFCNMLETESILQ